MNILHNQQSGNQLYIPIVSLIIGYLLWALCAQEQIVTVDYKLPVAFYNTTQPLEAPEYIACQLQAKRKALCTYAHNLGAIHIDATALKESSTTITITPADVFLRNDIQLVNYTPTTIQVNTQQ